MKVKDYFSPDVAEFLLLLTSHRVRYLIVGGEAVIHYGHVRLTGDIDILFDPTVQNTSRLFAALTEFWNGDIPGIGSGKELQKKGMVFQFGVPPNRIDLLNTIDGVLFANAWMGREQKRMWLGRSEKNVPYIGLDALIRNKRSVDRNKDREDLQFLLSVRKSRRT